ncbi:MAG: DUF1499 domain-containing protein [Bdellovibrionales bacterium]|nr:DUF1499 domain-containing protein [Bdellovibrionales bacterium]
MAFFLPPINDITTDSISPPRYEYLSTKFSNLNWAYRPENFVVQKAKYPEIKPLIIENCLPPEVFAQVSQIASAQSDWTVVNINSKERRLEATVTTLLLRFKDDVVIEIRPVPPGGSEVQMRSKSRVGRSDFGANSKRIARFFSLIEKHFKL